MRRQQRLLAGALIVVSVTLAIVAGLLVYKDFCRQRYAENVILIEKPRAESFWEITETKKGHLIRVKAGRFKGWYLACDDLVYSINSPSGFTTFGVGFRPRLSPYVRNLVLRERLGPGCCWKIEKTDRGSHIQATHGRYEGWYLDLLAEYVPDTGTDPRTAWNLTLNQNLVEGATWKVTRTERGHLIAATAQPYAEWCLDALQKANVLEGNRCRGEEPRKERQMPPLSK